MFKGYHIIIVPKDKNRTRSFKIAGLTLKVAILTVVFAIPVFFVSVLSAIHYQNKVVSLKRNNYENQKLIKNKNALIFKLAKIEKTLAVLDDSISHMSELMDVDPQTLKFGTGPIDDLDMTLYDSYDDEALFSMPEAEEVIDEWVDENGTLTVGKFDSKAGRLKDSINVLSKKLEEIFSQNKDKIQFVNANPNMMPVEGWITSDFGVRRHPIGRSYRMHNGIDIASNLGTAIKSPAAGKVVFSGHSRGYGNMIIVQHGYGVSTLYAHLKSRKVQKGEVITRGDVIGQVGSTGYATGPHLHYEVRVDGIPADPLAFLVN